MSRTPLVRLLALISTFSLSLTLMNVAAASTPLPDAFNSSIGATKNTINADGIDSAQIVVTIRDQNLNAIEGATVTLTSSRGSLDEIIPQKPTTDLLGKASFLVRSLRNGNSLITATVMNVGIQKTVALTFNSGLSINLQAGDLIKIPDDGNVKTLSDTAVYYYASNGKRYVFSNDKVYFTWYPDFSNVKILPIDQMSLIPIGGNVTYRPGSKLVKFQTDPKTYITTRGGVLRWVTSETIARAWFGANWNQNVDDINEAFYSNYTFGDPVGNALDLDVETIHANTISIDQDKNINQIKFP